MHFNQLINALDLFDFDFRKDRLLLDTTSVVAAAIEGLRGDPAEVADVRCGDVDETMEEFPHAGTTEGDAGAKNFTFAKLEVGDGLLRVGDRGPLAGDLLDLADGIVHGDLAVRGLAHAGGDDDFLQDWDLVNVRISELLLESRDYLFEVVLL